MQQKFRSTDHRCIYCCVFNRNVLELITKLLRSWLTENFSLFSGSQH